MGAGTRGWQGMIVGRDDAGGHTPSGFLLDAGSLSLSLC